MHNITLQSNTKKNYNTNRSDTTMKNKWNIGQGGNLPIGFGLSLAANTKSMQAFANMNDTEKQKVVEESRQMQTREDMENFVNRIGESYR